MNLLHTIHRAIYPNKCLFCQKALDNKQAYNCCVNQQAPFTYCDITKQPVYRLKYGGVRSLAAPMARAIADGLKSPPATACLVPVPLHPARLKERGFNQAALLAIELCRLLGLPMANGLVRTRSTAPQHGLSPEKRAENLKDAIAVKDCFIAAGRQILLVDDIYTTGTTIAECTRVLLSAGAASVETIVFAKV